MDEKTDCYIYFGDDIISYAGKEKPSQSEIEIIAEDVVVIPAFIDAHSHIGVARAGQPEDDDESNEHMESVFLLVNSLHSIYMEIFHLLALLT